MGGCKHILVVDDEPSARVLISRVLGKVGYEVTCVDSGEAALVHLAEHPADLLVVDKNLPRMSGFDVIDKAREVMPTLPVLLITATPDAQVIAQHKVDGYIGKPFRSLKALEDAVRDAFEAKQSSLDREKMQHQLVELQRQLAQKQHKPV